MGQCFSRSGVRPAPGHAGSGRVRRGSAGARCARPSALAAPLLRPSHPPHVNRTGSCLSTILSYPAGSAGYSAAASVRAVSRVSRTCRSWIGWTQVDELPDALVSCLLVHRPDDLHVAELSGLGHDQELGAQPRPHRRRRDRSSSSPEPRTSSPSPSAVGRPSCLEPAREARAAPRGLLRAHASITDREAL
jgi:hypothetical protein